MKTSQIIIGCITALIAVAAGLYTFITSKAYLNILPGKRKQSKSAKKKNAGKKAELKFLTVFAGCIFTVFALLSLYTFTLWMWVYFLMWIAVTFTLTYVISDRVRNSIKKRQKQPKEKKEKA